MPRSDYYERQAARADRLQERADKKRREGQAMMAA
jgi:hypothetical protein